MIRRELVDQFNDLEKLIKGSFLKEEQVEKLRMARMALETEHDCGTPQGDGCTVCVEAHEIINN